MSKLLTLATFFVMLGSKGCNLLAPLYIGQAAQVLSEGTVPYRDLAMYTTLRYLSGFLSELQKIIYLRVKQHAFAEIAGVSQTVNILVVPATRQALTL